MGQMWGLREEREKLGAIKQALSPSGVVPQVLSLRRRKKGLFEGAWWDTLPSDMAWAPVFLQLKSVSSLH